ncbi:MAG TPA: dephospho-CoA kinase [Wenzhouxiangella sp.]|nr:dephospho-CoA kinase [Wenzhouxiangella sp.]
MTETPASIQRHSGPGSAMLVALTGGVASGKSAVSGILEELGVPVVDTDVIARQVVAPASPGLARVVAEFGPGVLHENGSLNRARLGKLVFSSPSRRARLEAILHPLIEKQARHEIAQQAEADYVLLVVPLLVESGLFEDADCIVTVDVDEQTQVERLMRRSGMDEKQARAMLDAQTSRARRLEVADHVVDNSGSLEELRDRVVALHHMLVDISARRSQPA